MPLINGQKMACEPCIRGHRSTKCTHANERLMVPVRKPGRPLSSCPHLPNRNCGCSGVTAAIPRKQKCHCGTNSSESSFVTTPPGAAPAAVEAFSPTRTTFRVQKQVRSTPSRKLSTDAMAIERMDANQINILSPYTAASPKYRTIDPESNRTLGPSSSLPLDSRKANAHKLTMKSEQAFSSPTPYSIPSATSHTSISLPVGAELDSRVALPNSTLSPIIGSVTRGPSNGGNSCSCPGLQKKSHNGLASSPPVPSSKPVDQTRYDPDGCCSPPQGPTETPLRPIQTSSCSALPQFGQGINLFPQYFAPQPTIYTYPPLYGTYLHPLQPAQWKQTIASANYGQPLTTVPFQTPPTEPFENSTLGTSHTCSCGDSCQCVGCAAHPYNEATQRYVRSAWNSMVDTSNGPGEAYSSTPVVDTSSNNGKPAQAPDGGSPPSSQTPSDTASSDEPALSASDFFFVNYPFAGDACAGDTLSCPCGDDCQCLGCSIHNSSGIPG